MTHLTQITYLPLYFLCMQNSIRHSLSLGKYFRKVQSASGLPLESGKGYFWEFDPQNKATIMSEVERFLKQEGNSNVESISGELLPTVILCMHRKGVSLAAQPIYYIL